MAFTGNETQRTGRLSANQLIMRLADPAVRLHTGGGRCHVAACVGWPRVAVRKHNKPSRCALGTSSSEDALMTATQAGAGCLLAALPVDLIATNLGPPYTDTFCEAGTSGQRPAASSQH